MVATAIRHVIQAKSRFCGNMVTIFVSPAIPKGYAGETSETDSIIRDFHALVVAAALYKVFTYYKRNPLSLYVDRVLRDQNAIVFNFSFQRATR